MRHPYFEHTLWDYYGTLQQDINHNHIRNIEFNVEQPLTISHYSDPTIKPLALSV